MDYQVTVNTEKHVELSMLHLLTIIRWTYRNEITNPRAPERLRHTYGSPGNHVDLFVAGIAESVGSSEFLGPTFKWIIRNTLEKLRDGDRFFFQDKFQFSI